MKHTSQKLIRRKYFRKEMMPHMFCSGCGIGSIMSYTARAIDNLGLDMKDVVLVSGIGCSSRIPSYFIAHAVHTTHGRALAFSTGIKLSNPRLKVIVFSGDGDAISIGGNHFLHAIRRNLDVTLIVANNFSYGMTGGQLAPTTPRDSKTTTSPYGAIEKPIDIARTAMVLGAPYVARWTTAHPFQAISAIEKGLQKSGFSLIELLSPGPTCYGKNNKMADPIELIKWYRERCEIFKGGDNMTISEHLDEDRDKLYIGEFMDRERESFIDSYMHMKEGLP